MKRTIYLSISDLYIKMAQRAGEIEKFEEMRDFARDMFDVNSYRQAVNEIEHHKRMIGHLHFIAKELDKQC